MGNIKKVWSQFLIFICSSDPQKTLEKILDLDMFVYFCRSANSLKLYLNEQKKICKKLENISLKIHEDKIHQISLNNLYKIFNKIDMNFPTKSDIPVAGHGLKNRYCSILPNPITRLKLPTDESSQNQQLQTTDLILPNHDKFPENLPSEHLDTYINANWIRSWSWRTNYARDFCIIVSSCS